MQNGNNGGAAERGALITLNEKFGEAEKARDTAFFEEALSDDLIFRRANGLIVTKQIFLADLKSPDNNFDRFDAEVEEPTVYDGAPATALVSVRVRAKGKRCTTEFNGLFRNTRFFVKENDRWRCVFWFNTKIE